MNNLYFKIIAILILISFNYSCDALCNDEDSPSAKKEAAVLKKADSLNISITD